MNKKEEIIQMLKDNPIKIIKCGDIEIPIEYLKQTTVNVNGDDYIRLQQENKQLKMINKEYERLNKEKNRGFKITNVQEYNIDKLLSYKKYKDNWNRLKEWLESNWEESQDIWFVKIINKMQELEQGSDSK